MNTQDSHKASLHRLETECTSRRPIKKHSEFFAGKYRFVGKFRCPTCHSIHYGISESDALSFVQETNAYLASLSDEECQEWYGGSSISIGRFKRCFYCGTINTALLPLNKEGKNFSVSHQPVIVPLVKPGKTK